MKRSRTGNDAKSLSQIFRQLDFELTALLHDVKDIEQALAESLRHDNALSAQSISHLQKIDHVGQALEALAQYSGNVSKLLPADDSVELAGATKSILLSDIAMRLVECSGPVVRADPGSRDIDLF